MSTVFIVYNPGYAGTLFHRLLCLSPSVVPHLQINKLKRIVETAVPEPPDPYSFSFVNTYYTNWQLFHRDYADFYYHSLYTSLRDLPSYNNYEHIVYSIHPLEFRYLEQDILKINDARFFYVDLDLGKYNNWLTVCQQQLGWETRDNESTIGLELKNAYNMDTISLTNVLKSNLAFLDEYVVLCDKLKIKPDIDSATKLYKDWRSVRFDNFCIDR